MSLNLREQKRGLFEVLGVSVPGPETEKEQDYEDEEEPELPEHSSGIFSF